MLVSLAFTLALAIAPTVVSLQKPVDFNGTWVEDESARKVTPPVEAPRPGQPVTPQLSGPPPEQIITQTPQAIRIDRPWQHGVVKFIYTLDGAESVNLNGANTLTTRSRWENGRLVTEGTSYSETSAGESTWQFKEVRWLDAKGTMHTDTVNIDEAGKTHRVLRAFRKK